MLRKIIPSDAPHGGSRPSMRSWSDPAEVLRTLALLAEIHDTWDDRVAGQTVQGMPRQPLHEPNMFRSRMAHAVEMMHDGVYDRDSGIAGSRNNIDRGYSLVQRGRIALNRYNQMG